MISIIVPIYNCQEYLDKCINSIMCQTYKDIEILLINDGSTDNSLNICNYYGSLDSRIKVISKENSGVSSTRNIGIDNASGKYLQFVDADDWLEFDCCESFISAIENENCDLAIFSYKNIFERKGSENEVVSVNLPIEGVFEINDFVDKLYIFNDHPLVNGVCWNKIYSTEIIKKNKIRFLENVKLHEDAIFNFEVFKTVSKITLTNKPIYNYYCALNNHSLSKKAHSEIVLYTHLYYEKLLELYDAYHINDENNMAFWGRNCYSAFIYCIIDICNNENSVKMQYNKLFGILNDSVFVASIPYARPSKLIYKFIHNSIVTRNIIFLILIVNIINLRINLNKYFFSKIKSK